MKWDNEGDTGSIQYREEDETAHSKISVSSSNNRRSSGDGASLSNGSSEVLNSDSDSEVQNVDNLQSKPGSNVGYVTVIHDNNESKKPSNNLEMPNTTGTQIQNETTV